jgi:tryptophan-specific transport protein
MSIEKPLWHGVLLVAGGAVGAGMFALPTVSAGAWMLWSLVGLLIVGLMTYLSASVLTKVNLALVSQEQGGLGYNSSFGSLVRVVLGPRWAAVNNVSIVFIMMILMYAYISAGASIISYSLQSIGFDVSPDARNWLSLGFAALVALIVWLGTSIVSRVTLVLMVAMALTFGVATAGILPSVDLARLTSPTNTFPYLLAALPAYVTAFACAGLVPSLVRHYATQPKKVSQSILWGALLVLAVYLFWLLVTLGSIGREGFIEVIVAGGNIGDLVKALVNTGANPTLQARLNVFSHCAIMTSFLSVGLGLFHFTQDKLALGNDASQRLIAVACCFVPPAFGSFFLPYGFVHAIGYAGFFVAFSFFILPGVMALAIKADYRLAMCKLMPCVVIVFGVLVLGLKGALVLSWLPSFG